MSEFVPACFELTDTFEGDFERARRFEGAPPTTDFELLGVVLLQCMSGKAISTDIAYVKRQRSKHRLYGLDNADLWIQYKSLLDFLDALLWNEKKTLQNGVSSHEVTA